MSLSRLIRSIAQNKICIIQVSIAFRSVMIFIINKQWRKSNVLRITQTDHPVRRRGGFFCFFNGV